MNTAEKLKLCRGCDDDFYNDHNPIGVKQCWMLKAAKLVTRYTIGYWTPMDTAKNLREVQVLNCYHERGSSRLVYMKQVPSHLAAEWHQLQRDKKRSEKAPATNAVDPHAQHRER